MDARVGKDRLIVALDVPTHEEALEVVGTLDNVSFFKIGLQLFLRGDLLSFIERLRDTRAGEGGVFVDLKLSGDIGHTIGRFVEGCAALDVKFITLSEAVSKSKTIATIQAVRDARGQEGHPHILMVPLFSSLDAEDREAHDPGDARDVNSFILDRGRAMLRYGCDGLIVSGEAIKACKEELPPCDLVSPGIRPAGFPPQDHKRHTTPAEAIRYGADYLVVGRPILDAADPRQAAQDIIDEVDRAL